MKRSGIQDLIQIFRSAGYQSGRGTSYIWSQDTTDSPLKRTWLCFLLFLQGQPSQRPWRVKMAVFRPDHPQWEQNLWSTLLREAMSIVNLFSHWSSSFFCKLLLQAKKVSTLQKRCQTHHFIKSWIYYFTPLQDKWNHYWVLIEVILDLQRIFFTKRFFIQNNQLFHLQLSKKQQFKNLKRTQVIHKTKYWSTYWQTSVINNPISNSQGDLVTWWLDWSYTLVE